MHLSAHRLSERLPVLATADMPTTALLALSREAGDSATLYAASLASLASPP